MHIVLGASGHIGSELARTLLAQGEPVWVILHNDKKAADWQQQGARVSVVDVHDTKALHQVFRQGQRLFLLNPPADPATDTAIEEGKTVASIVAALADSGLEKIVAESTYGAQPGEHLGDLSTLYELEQALAAQPIPTTIIRAAYYMSNWDAALKTAQEEGKIHTFYPLGFKLPMVAPADIAQLAARLLREPISSTGLHNIEGPARYSSTEVATAFAEALHRPVAAQEVPREQWLPALQKMGFSEKAAESFANMTAATLDSQAAPLQNPERGATTLGQYVQALVQRQQ